MRQLRSRCRQQSSCNVAMSLQSLQVTCDVKYYLKCVMQIVKIFAILSIMLNTSLQIYRYFNVSEVLLSPTSPPDYSIVW